MAIMEFKDLVLVVGFSIEYTCIQMEVANVMFAVCSSIVKPVPDVVSRKANDLLLLV